MKTEKKSRSFNFLIEMLITVIFFTLSSIICVQLFVSGQKRSQLSSDMTQAVIETESMAEKLRSDTLLKEAQNQEVIQYDKHWQLSEVPYFTITITVVDQQVSESMIRTQFLIEAHRVADQQLLSSIHSSSLVEVNP